MALFERQRISLLLLCIVELLFCSSSKAHPDLSYEAPAKTQCQKDIAEFEAQLDNGNPMAIKSITVY